MIWSVGRNTGVEETTWNIRNIIEACKAITEEADHKRISCCVTHLSGIIYHLTKTVDEETKTADNTKSQQELLILEGDLAFKLIPSALTPQNNLFAPYPIPCSTDSSSLRGIPSH